jgi:hypothetical protein
MAVMHFTSMHLPIFLIQTKKCQNKIFFPPMFWNGPFQKLQNEATFLEKNKHLPYYCQFYYYEILTSMQEMEQTNNYVAKHNARIRKTDTSPRD